MARQLNIFIENRPGRLRRITGPLAQAGINIRAFMIQDHGDCGVVKLLVDDPAKAQALLKEQGAAVASCHVLAVDVADRPGGLDELARVMEEQGINMLEACAFVIQPGRHAVCCIEVDAGQMAAAEELLRAKGFNVIADEALLAL